MMTYHILFNPKSRNGSHPKTLNKISKKLKSQKVFMHNVLEIKDPKAFAKSLHKEDIIVIVGGDGTLHHFVNQVDMKSFEGLLSMFQSGTGNDFIRSLKTKEDFPFIHNQLKELPTVSIAGVTHKFVNGIDIGLGGHVGHIIESRGRKKSKFEFFRSTLVAIKEFKPFELSLKALDIDVTEKKIWFVAVMHGAYFGGGMHIAPKQQRNQKTLSVIVAKNCPKWLLFVIFPSIYIGKHFWFKKYIDYYQVTSATIKTRYPQIAELDGEVQRNVTQMDIMR